MNRTPSRFTPPQGQAPKPAPAAKPRRMTLETITTGVVEEPPRIFLYGDGGLGKTTFFSEAPGAVFLDTQDGTKKIKGAKRFRRPDTWEDVLEAIDELLSTEHEHKMFIIDLVDDVERLIWTHICKRDGKDNIEGYGFNKGPTIALVEWRQLLAKLERLRREKRMGIGIVGHAGVCKFKNPEAEDYGMFGPQIDGKASTLIRGWCDTVLFAREDTYTRTDATKRVRGFSTGARLLFTTGKAAYYAKNRDNLPEVLPLDWHEFAAAVAAGMSPEVLRAEIKSLMERVDEETRAKADAFVTESGDDATRLARLLNRLREKVGPEQQQTDEEDGQ